MAISGGDGSIILTTKVDESGLKKGFASMRNFAGKAGKSFAIIGAAAATATVAITKMAVSAYADYEQLIGGVETLFKKSADKVKAYAEDAFYTAGMSANQYMEQVIGISAMLIKSTGDTERAADIADMAIRDMADNVNKMGTDMARVQMAYQGFARQQYVLLDNLAIGYGGTKQEMERLLRDAEALTGVKYDINNLADVYSAIHAIQEELGITGTTVKEAEKTITGSANMMKAAWQNVLTAISSGRDIDKAINNLVYSVQKYFENIVPVVERSMQGVGQLIEKVAPMLVQTVARSLIRAIPSLLNAVYEMILGLAKGIYQGIVDLFSGGAEKTLQAQTNQIAQSVENQNALTEAVKETEKAQKGALAGFDELNTLSNSAVDVQIGSFGTMSSGEIVTEKNVNITQKANKEYGIFDKIMNKLSKTLSPLKNISFKNLTKSLENLRKALAPFKNLALNSLDYLWREILKPMSTWTIETLIPAFLDMLAAALEALSPILEAIQPTLDWFWFTIIKPMATFVGDAFIYFLNLLTEAFTKFSDWAKENPEKVKIIADIILGFLAGLWIYKAEKNIIGFVGNLITKFKEFGGISGIMSSLGAAINSPAGAISALTAAGLFWVQNWDEIKNSFEGMSSWGKITTVVLGLATAIAVLWVALSAGLAAAGIVAGLGALGLGAWILTMGSETPELTAIPSDSIVMDSVPVQKVGAYSIPRCAQGTVIPGGKEFLAILGDQPRGQTNVEAPLDTIKQALAEVMTDFGGGGNSQPIIIEIDGKEVFRAVKNAETRYGSRLVTGGV